MSVLGVHGADDRLVRRTPSRSDADQVTPYVFQHSPLPINLVQRYTTRCIILKRRGVTLVLESLSVVHRTRL